MIRLPSPIDRSTTYQVNRLRTVLAWLEDNAHTLPDGWSLIGGTGSYPSLAWWGRSGYPEVETTVDTAEAVARLTEAHGTPEQYGLCREWHVDLGVGYRLRLAVYRDSEVSS